MSPSRAHPDEPRTPEVFVSLSRPSGSLDPAASPDLPPAQGLYDSRFEHDACGVNFIVHMKGLRSHTIVQHGIGAPVAEAAPDPASVVAFADLPSSAVPTALSPCYTRSPNR